MLVGSIGGKWRIALILSASWVTFAANDFAALKEKILLLDLFFVAIDIHKKQVRCVGGRVGKALTLALSKQLLTRILYGTLASRQPQS